MYVLYLILLHRICATICLPLLSINSLIMPLRTGNQYFSMKMKVGILLMAVISALNQYVTENIHANILALQSNQIIPFKEFR